MSKFIKSVCSIYESIKFFMTGVSRPRAGMKQEDNARKLVANPSDLPTERCSRGAPVSLYPSGGSRLAWQVSDRS